LPAILSFEEAFDHRRDFADADIPMPFAAVDPTMTGDIS
jgi:hypothetical protein